MIDLLVDFFNVLKLFKLQQFNIISFQSNRDVFHLPWQPQM